MADDNPETHRLAVLPRLVALAVLAATSGAVVWSFHSLDWPAFLASMGAGLLVVGVAGGLVGVRLNSSWATMGLVGGLFEGAYLGWCHLGWLGAVPGGLIGAVVGMFGATLLALLASFVLVLCGADPVVSVDPGPGHRTGASEER